MTTLYQVISAEDIDYEKNDRDVVSVCLTLEKAIENATKVLENMFFNRYRDKSDVFIASFSQFNDFSELLSNLFNREQRYVSHSCYRDVYIIAVEEGEITDNHSIDNVVWNVNAECVFGLFCKHLDNIMIRDNLDLLPMEEKDLLWDKFRKNGKILENNRLPNKRVKLSMMGNRISISTQLEYSKSGADIWAMTAANDDDMYLYERYELK